MEGVLEYFLIGGNMRIGKKEMVLDLLRKDSILRGLFGYEAGYLTSLLREANVAGQQEYVIVNFSGFKQSKLSGDPTPLLNELKTRYGSSVGGILRFCCSYTSMQTYMHPYFLQANLETDDIVLELT